MGERDISRGDTYVEYNINILLNSSPLRSTVVSVRLGAADLHSHAAL